MINSLDIIITISHNHYHHHQHQYCLSVSLSLSFPLLLPLPLSLRIIIIIVDIVHITIIIPMILQISLDTRNISKYLKLFIFWLGRRRCCFSLGVGFVSVRWVGPTLGLGLGLGLWGWGCGAGAWAWLAALRKFFLRQHFSRPRSRWLRWRSCLLGLQCEAEGVAALPLELRSWPTDTGAFIMPTPQAPSPSPPHSRHQFVGRHVG